MKTLKHWVNTYRYIRDHDPAKHDEWVVLLEKRIKALEERPQFIAKTGPVEQMAPCWGGLSQIPEPKLTKDPVEQLHEMQAESYRHDILAKDPIELFKEDRQPWYTTCAIRTMAFLHIKTVQQLIGFSPKELHRVALKRQLGFGMKTISYIDHCLRRHGLKLRDN